MQLVIEFETWAGLHAKLVDMCGDLNRQVHKKEVPMHQKVEAPAAPQSVKEMQEQVFDAPAPAKVDRDSVRARVSKLAQGEQRNKVKDLLGKYGSSSVSGLKEGDLAAFSEELSTLE